MPDRHYPRQHLRAVFGQVLSFHDRDLAPSVPIHRAVAGEDHIEPAFVERHVGAGMPEQLLELAALVIDQLLRGPVLALEQHIVELVHQIVRGGHGSFWGQSRTLGNMRSAPRSRGSVGRGLPSQAPQDGDCPNRHLADHCPVAGDMLICHL